MQFADATNTELRWLLYGDEPRRPLTTGDDALGRLQHALRVMQERAPWKVEPVLSMVEAAAESTAPPGAATPPSGKGPR